MGKKNTIGFIISIIITIFGIFLNLKKFGIEFIFLTFAFSYLYDNLKNLTNAISETINEYSIEDKKQK